MDTNVAYMLASIAHTGQVDKSGHDYISHPTRVARRVADVLGPNHPAVAVAWLHDVVEDTDISLARLELCGAVPDQLDAIAALTHAPTEPQRDYLVRVASSDVATIVKLADIADNSAPERLAELDVETQVRLRKKYSRALAVLSELTGIPNTSYDSPALIRRLLG